ncbi:hypothetical protein GCM10007897_10020 [Sphingobium jiangsuense]|uniref:PilZ domain-containing protein n=1 Tax=Sphingobium jiangsuense TaxID=870476 RepID=A0A7W6BRA5_9SPHN|nr:PilZ domain-containing protein [Sphingobium jiangsuense]MBB3927338.1 hypothetical protein [Sphingobium jiangsuense]GLS99620.1 hypothetical protein GCM10007897_10020 [Sphingobium jiangsuense]
MLHSKITQEEATPVAEGQVEDRRASQRYVTVLKVGRAVVDGQDQLCLVRNMSRDGAKLDLRGTVRTDQKIMIELRSDKVVTGTVRWTGDHVAGIEFDEPVDVQDMLQSRPTRSVLRKLPRAPRFLAAGRVLLELEGGGSIGGSIVNISLHGLCLETQEVARIDDVVVARVDGLPARRGTVRWVRNGMTGLHFDMPMGFSELARWLETHQPKL